MPKITSAQTQFGIKVFYYAVFRELIKGLLLKIRDQLVLVITAFEPT